MGGQNRGRRRHRRHYGGPKVSPGAHFRAATTGNTATRAGPQIMELLLQWTRRNSKRCTGVSSRSLAWNSPCVIAVMSSLNSRRDRRPWNLFATIKSSNLHSTRKVSLRRHKTTPMSATMKRNARSKSILNEKKNARSSCRPIRRKLQSSSTS